MITLVISLLVLLIIVGMLIWATDQIAGAFGIPAPVPVVIKVVIVLIACLIILERASPGTLSLR
jgi:hypothetical protein